MSELFKLSGGGNDFLALAEPTNDPTPGEIVAWCARGLSLGADGLFVVRRRAAGGVAMRYWNADGGEAALCINGTRCAARLALELGWVRGSFPVATAAGVFAARATAPTVIALTLPAPAGRPRRHVVSIGETTVDGWLADPGVPHFVVLWPASLAAAPVAELGPPLRAHPEFGTAGANVDFVRFPSCHELEIRSYERGVEGETLACGSGVLAAVAVGLQLGLAKLPVTAATLGGFALAVDGQTADGAPRHWSLAGDARLLARIAATAESALPPPPAARWSA